jgi:hypothetical protein
MDQRIRFGAALAALLAAFAVSACAGTFFDKLRPSDSVSDIQKRYTRLVRWNEFARASQYVDPELREGYLNDARGLRGCASPTTR